MKMHAIATIMALGAAFLCFSAGAENSSVLKPWSNHCTTRGIPTRDAKEAAHLEAMATRCEPRDACVLSCSRSGCADFIAGGCYHVCRGGIPEQLVEGADRWEAKTSCRLPVGKPPGPGLPRS